MVEGAGAPESLTVNLKLSTISNISNPPDLIESPDIETYPLGLGLMCLESFCYSPQH